MSTRAQIFAAKDIPDDLPVECPEWGCTLYVRHLTALELHQLGTWCREGTEADGPFKAIVAAVVDREGKPVFEADDVALLRHRSNAVIRRLSAAINRANGVEEAVKN